MAPPLSRYSRNLVWRSCTREISIIQTSLKTGAGSRSKSLSLCVQGNDPARSAWPSVSVRKGKYQARRKESRAQGMEKCTPYAYCFRVLCDRLLSESNSWVSGTIRQVRAAIQAEGISFILERGHKNNSEVKLLFREVRQRHNLEGVLESISFQAKHDSRAIQLADLFAYYSRRNVRNQGKGGIEPILEIICRSVRHHDFIVTDVSD